MSGKYYLFFVIGHWWVGGWVGGVKQTMGLLFYACVPGFCGLRLVLKGLPWVGESIDLLSL